MPEMLPPEEIRHREIIAELKKIEGLLEKGLFPEVWNINSKQEDENFKV